MPDTATETATWPTIGEINDVLARVDEAADANDELHIALFQLANPESGELAKGVRLPTFEEIGVLSRYIERMKGAVGDINHSIGFATELRDAAAHDLLAEGGDDA